MARQLSPRNARPEHSQDEESWISLGFSRQARVLEVAYVKKIEGERVRIISARKGVRSEMEQYNSR
jgi:uncharacterized DUF497 family protein